MVYIYLVNTCPLTASTATRIVVIPDRSIPLVHTNRDKAHPFHNLDKIPSFSVFSVYHQNH